MFGHKHGRLSNHILCACQSQKTGAKVRSTSTSLKKFVSRLGSRVGITPPQSFILRSPWEKIEPQQSPANKLLSRHQQSIGLTQLSGVLLFSQNPRQFAILDNSQSSSGCDTNNGDPNKMRRTLTKPMSLEYSLKHCRHRLIAYFLISPCRLPHTRLRKGNKHIDTHT